MEATTELIRFEHVYKTFGEKAVCEDLDLAVLRGETVAILGGSGAGKSVLLKMLTGLMKPDSGSICFDGVDLVPLSDRALIPYRARISMLFQGGALFDSLDVAENVAYPLRVQRKLDHAQIMERVRWCLRQVGLEGIEQSLPAALSGGMKKRVALARAIAPEPEVLLFDEPTTGLDPLNTRRISELIREIQRSLEVTSIVVTHDLAAAAIVADRMALLANRRIAADLPTKDFLSARDPLIHEFVNALPSAPRAPGLEASAGAHHGL